MNRMNIAVVGAGSSGLVTLKYLRDAFPEANIVCFEKGQSIRGCWGNQREDFISTSTKYTTQFSCFRKWKPTVSPTKDYTEFYQGAEFGDYLEAFAEEFSLKDYVRFGVALEGLERKGNKWQLTLSGNTSSENAGESTQTFDAVYLCTGLVNQKVALESHNIPIAENPEAVRDATVVVVGGGESATDLANHLAKAEYNNTVYLSLRSGVRVSPRYHPIRGVPSDFLRNRLLLSFDKQLRNKVGEAFVSFRIRFNQALVKLFPHQELEQDDSKEEQRLRKEWDMKLKARAKGALFNVFHNKSDAFLDAIAQKRLSIIGPATDNSWSEYSDFEQVETLQLKPDVLVPSTGFRSKLADFSNNTLRLADFYHGCAHVNDNNLFLIGFARPIIGNIPTISEMQARYTVGLLARKYSLPIDVKTKQAEAFEALTKEYSTLDTSNVYPVEQFPYCDVLAKEMGIMPSLQKIGSFRTWLKLMLAPASTTHYQDEYFDKSLLQQEKVYTPSLLIGIMFLMRFVVSPWRYRST